MKPRYFDERKEIQIFVEYLIDSDDTIHKTLENHTQTLTFIDIATLRSEIIQKQNKNPQLPTDDCL